MTDWIAPTGAMIEAIGTDDFAPRLSEAVKAIAPYDYTVVFGYRGAAPPQDLYDDFPAAKRKVYVEDYQVGPYLLDPIFLACAGAGTSGLHRLRDLAPDRFYQGEYFLNYYKATGLAEEIAYFIDMPGGDTVTVSLMRTAKPFSAREIRELASYWPVLRAAGRKHWARSLPLLIPKETAALVPKMQQSVALAFESFGKAALTPRERQVVEYTLKGHSAEAVGRILGISSGTVRIHRRNIYSKLRIRSQGELFSMFIITLTGPTPV
ncbi:MAG: helix-turn-helix transcriptional regulator [Paracoccaceae bacterium]|nr:helix-turn-helix transcriptional regulator [Paracoccaceae bacterium]